MGTETKPAQLAKLIKGKTLYCVDNFCDTVNWLTSCWDHVKAQYGVKISGTESGEPVIEADVEAGDGVTIEPSRGEPTKIAANLTAGDGIVIEGEQDDGSLKISTYGLAVASGESCVEGVKKIVLQSGDDSNVTFSLTGDSEGTVTVAVDVYYK